MPMANFTVLGGLVIKGVAIVLPFLFLWLLLKKRRSQFSTILLAIFLLFTTITAFFFFVSLDKEKDKLSKKYAGSYKLGKLNCEECNNCRIELHEDYRYDIIQNRKIVGNGEWSVEVNPETGYFLKIENGPIYINHEPEGEIEYIGTKACR